MALPQTRLAHVASVDRVTPRTIRVVLAGEGLRDMRVGAFTDAYVKLLFPPAGAPYAVPFDLGQVRATLPRHLHPRARTFTVRAWDPALARMTIDFVHHGDTGVAGPWAAAARPGDAIQFAGPGGGYAPDPDADWHLLAGDASALPAIAASLARIPAGVPARVLLHVAGPEERQALPDDGDIQVTWLHDATHDPELLVAAVRALELPSGRAHAFVHGEAEAVRRLRRHLVVERGVAPAALSASGYWKRSRTDEAWRAEKADWSRALAADETSR